MKKRRFIATTSIVLIFSILLSSSEFAASYDGESTAQVVRAPKEGFNEVVETVTEVIGQEEAASLYQELVAEISPVLGSGEQTIFDLLGAELSTERTLAAVNNVRSSENYVRFTLNNGGSIGYDEALGIVNVKNFNRSEEISHEKSLNDENEIAKKRLRANAQNSTFDDNKNRVFTREQIGKMSGAEFARNEKAIMEQLKKGLIR